MVTQCPICPGGRYTYRYNVTGQEGTLWWHAHSSMLRATVHGAIVIRPRNGDHGYPFPKPHKEEIIMLGTYYWPPKFYPSHQGRAGINRALCENLKWGLLDRPNITIKCRVLIKYLFIRGHLLFFYNKSIHSSFLRLS